MLKLSRAQFNAAEEEIRHLKQELAQRDGRIEKLEAALDDVATYLPRAEWHYLKDETLITIGEKKDG
jgi:hypothetical protein